MWQKAISAVSGGGGINPTFDYASGKLSQGQTSSAITVDLSKTYVIATNLNYSDSYVRLSLSILASGVITSDSHLGDSWARFTLNGNSLTVANPNNSGGDITYSMAQLD